MGTAKITHSVTVTKPNDPTKEISSNAWNADHRIEDHSIELTKLVGNVIPSTPPLGKKKITNLYWDGDTQEIVIEYEQ